MASAGQKGITHGLGKREAYARRGSQVALVRRTRWIFDNIDKAPDWVDRYLLLACDDRVPLSNTRGTRVPWYRKR